MPPAGGTGQPVTLPAGTGVAGADRAGAAELGAADGAIVAELAGPREPSALAACPLWARTATAAPTVAITSSTTAPVIMPVRKLMSSSQALMTARRPE
ncbi:MAG: hypothetical protein WAK44_13450 [Trebonia sp.]|uniref:hypothetical protein n=1 Tax=Trebonia sp. TaxID=2767075 RepID=UPI003BB1151C